MRNVNAAAAAATKVFRIYIFFFKSALPAATHYALEQHTRVVKGRRWIFCVISTICQTAPVGTPPLLLSPSPPSKPSFAGSLGLVMWQTGHRPSRLMAFSARRLLPIFLSADRRVAVLQEALWQPASFKHWHRPLAIFFPRCDVTRPLKFVVINAPRW